MIFQDMTGEDDLFTYMMLRRAVHNLPDKHRAVIALRMAGYKQKECGAILGVTRAAIGFIQKRAIEMLRQELGGSPA